jgi:ABC-type branched-subunit amino acid transport system ATPase component
MQTKALFTRCSKVFQKQASYTSDEQQQWLAACHQLMGCVTMLED